MNLVHLLPLSPLFRVLKEIKHRLIEAVLRPLDCLVSKTHNTSVPTTGPSDFEAEEKHEIKCLKISAT